MKTVNIKKTGRNIERVIKQKGLTIQEVAELMECQPQTIKNWVSGTTFPKTKHLLLFVYMMHISLDDIVVTEDG